MFSRQDAKITKKSITLFLSRLIVWMVVIPVFMGDGFVAAKEFHRISGIGFGNYFRGCSVYF